MPENNEERDNRNQLMELVILIYKVRESMKKIEEIANRLSLREQERQNGRL